MKQQLENIRVQALAALDAAETPAALEELRVSLLGKKGELTAVLKQMGKLTPEEITESLIARAEELHAEKEVLFTPDTMRELERVILLRNVDEKWVDHITAMEEL